MMDLRDHIDLIRALEPILEREPPESGWATPKSERPRCGARCRDGHECRAPAVWDKKRDRPVNGRCRMHGGLSTGPRTLEGRRRALANLRQNQATTDGK